MADGSGPTESDFLDAVDEASQSGPLPQPPASERPPRTPDPTQLVASPAPRRRALISPTRPLPKVAAPIEGKQGPVQGSKADRTTTGEASMLVRATASAVPTRGARIDSGAEPTSARGGTKASMPAPVIVHAPTEGSRPIRILSDDSKQIRITDAESRPIPIGADDSKQIRLGREAGAPTTVGRDDSRQVRLGTGKPAASGRDDSKQIRLGRETKPPPLSRDDSSQIRLGREATKPPVSREPAKPAAVARDDSKPFKVGVDDSKPIRVGTDDVTQARARPTAIEDDESGPTQVGRRATATLPPPARGSVTRPDGSNAGAKPKLADPPPPARSGVTVPDGSATFEPPKSRTQPSLGGQVQMIDAAVAAALVDAQERVTAMPGRVERDAAAKGRTQVTPIVPLERPPGSVEPARVAQPAPIGRTPAPVAVPPRGNTAAVLRKVWQRVPNWAVAAAFGVIGLGAGVVIAGGSDDDDAAVRADAPPSRVASATPTPPPAKTIEPPARPAEPPVAPPPVLDEPPTETPEIVAMVDDTPQLLDDTASTSATTTDAAPRRRWRRRPQREPLQSSAPEPEPESDPEPPPTRPKPRPPSASALLQQARSALADGEYASAYRLARRSHGVSPSDDALGVMARAACRRDDKDGALSALRQMPLLDRAPVRRDCRKAGSRIGL